MKNFFFVLVLFLLETTLWAQPYGNGQGPYAGVGGSGGGIAGINGTATNTSLYNPTNYPNGSSQSQTIMPPSGYLAGTTPIYSFGALAGNYQNMFDDLNFNGGDIMFRLFGGPGTTFNGQFNIPSVGPEVITLGGFYSSLYDFSYPYGTYIEGPFALDNGFGNRTFRLVAPANAMVEFTWPRPFGPHLEIGLTSQDPEPSGFGSAGNGPPLAGPEIQGNMPIAPMIITFPDFFLYNPTNRSTFEATNYIYSILTNYANSGVSAALTNAGIPMMMILDFFWQQTNRDANNFLSVNPLNGVTNSPVTGPMPNLNWYATNCHLNGELASVALAWGSYMVTNGSYEVDSDFGGHQYYRFSSAGYNSPAVSYPITTPLTTRFDIMNLISNGVDAVHLASIFPNEYPAVDDYMVQHADDAVRIVFEQTRQQAITRSPINVGGAQLNGGLISMWIEDGNPGSTDVLLSERAALTCNLFICGNGGGNGTNSLDSVHWFLEHMMTNYVSRGMMGPGHLPVYSPQLVASYTTNFYQAAETMAAVCCFPLMLPPCLQNSQPTAANYPYT